MPRIPGTLRLRRLELEARAQSEVLNETWPPVHTAAGSGLVKCPVCMAVVERLDTARHALWHRTVLKLHLA